MVIVMKAGATQNQIADIERFIRQHDARAHISEGEQCTIVGVIGYKHTVRREQLLVLPGVDKVIPISQPYKLVSREFKRDDTVISLNGVRIGGEEPVVIAGPCSVENEKQVLETARAVKNAGGHLLRGGAFKPRTSPYSFQGLGEEGLKLLKRAKAETGLYIVTEVLQETHVPLVARYADILQIGARNMQNYELLKAVGRSMKPVLLKRGMSATLTEFLMSAEYIMSEGNNRVILCERGIRTFVEYSRNTLDLNVVPAIRRISHLPVLVDPSHGTARRELVEPLSLGALAVGANGLMVEVHPRPEKAWSDAEQTLNFTEFEHLMRQVGYFSEYRRKVRQSEETVRPEFSA